MSVRSSPIIIVAFIVLTACSGSSDGLKEPAPIAEGRRMCDMSAYEDAERHFAIVLDSARGAEDTLLIAMATKWLGNIQLAYQQKHVALNRYSDALALLDTLIVRSERAGKSAPLLAFAERKNIQNNVGNAYLDLSRFDESETMFRDVLTYDRAHGDPLSIAVSLYNLGLLQYIRTNAEVKDGDARKFNQGMEEAKALLFESLEVFPTGDAYFNLGNVYAFQDRLDSAVYYMQKALPVYQENGYRNQTSLTLGNIGVFSYQKGDANAAVEALAPAIQIIEELRGAVSSVDVRSSFLSNKHYLYEYMIAALMDLGRMEEAFEYVERAKARSFLDMIGNKAIGENKERSPELAALIDREGQMQERLARIAEVPDSSEVYIDLLTEYRKILARMKELDPEYASVKTIDPLPVRDLQELLSDSSAVLEYFLGSFRFAAFVVRRDTLLGVTLKTKQFTDINAEIEHLRRKLFYNFPNRKIQFLREQRMIQKKSIDDAYKAWYTSEADGSWQHDLLNMHSKLVFPVKKYLSGVSEVYIVPHGALHHLPFQALIDGPGNLDRSKGVHVPRPRFWIEDMAIAYLPSASVLRYARDKQGAHPGTALIIGDPLYADIKYRRQPLEGALVEADSVASYVRNPEVLKRGDAEEARVKADIGTKNLIHFATHGELNKEEPMESRILLAAEHPEGRNDGNLTVAEVFNLDLNASLVTLSACQTAQLSSEEGRFDQGDDLVGLTRSFLYAGTPSVIASLWYVDDAATLAWMVHFYRAWKDEGRTKIQAAREAAVRMLEAPKNPDWVVPYYWSAFIFIGDSEQTTTFE